MDNNLRNGIVHILILFILLLVLLGTLVFTGILGCEIVPGGCDLYYNFVKQRAPKILLVYGEGGLGDIAKLESVLGDRDILGKQTYTMDIEKITYGNLLDYDLVIVEHAKKICNDKLKLFQNYVSSGGRLVWTGDAGAELCPTDSYLTDDQRNEGGQQKILGPWARQDFGKQLSFDEFLGVQYIGNYCEFSRCEREQFSGYIEVVDMQDKLTYGLSPQISYNGDFAVVKAIKGGDSKVAAVIDNTTDLFGKSTGKPWLENGKQYNFGRKLPFIASSGVGSRVAYYSAPIESFVSDEQPGRYKALIEQMYYGMLYR